jgi:hypothetical protein
MSNVHACPRQILPASVMWAWVILLRPAVPFSVTVFDSALCNSDGMAVATCTGVEHPTEPTSRLMAVVTVPLSELR